MRKGDAYTQPTAKNRTHNQILESVNSPFNQRMVTLSTAPAPPDHPVYYVVYVYRDASYDRTSHSDDLTFPPFHGALYVWACHICL